MANTNDSQIIKDLIQLPVSKQLPYFLKIKDNIIDDSTYWQVLAGIWMMSDICSPYLQIWRELFTAPRRNRHKLMKGLDRKFWRRLPKVVIGYRAVNPGEDIDSAISWTLCLEVALKLAKGRKIITREFTKESIVAYFNRRGESEIICLVPQGEKE